MSRTRAALRIARRDALRAKGRSALVLGMIGLPMLALAFTDVATRTAALPAAERARRVLGTADLLVPEHVANGPIRQYALYDYSTESPPVAGSTTPPAESVVRAALPAGSTIEVRDTVENATVRTPARALSAAVHRLAANGALAAGTVRLRGGRLANAPGEVAVTKQVARTLRLRVGSDVTVGTATFRVVGLVVDPASLGAAEVYVAPDATLPGAPTAHEYAVGLPAGARDLDAMAALNRIGFRVVPRTWFFHPPPQRNGLGSGSQSVGLAVVVVGLAALEIVLLAGTAFAVGARRQRRALALVAAAGGDRKDVRRIVLAGAVVLGGAAAVLGIAGGVALVTALRPLNEARLAGSLMGPLDVRPLELLAIVGVGVGTALLAALLPARTASRQEVVAALTGRRSETTTRKRVPVIALTAVAAGAALAFWSAGTRSRPASFPLVLAGAVVAELGFVACAPGLVGLVGRLGTRLPLSLRLAARDAARHRSRSGPATAAVVAAVAGSVAVSVFLASDLERQRRAYQQAIPAGSVRILRDPEGVDANVDAAAKVLPVRSRFDLVPPATTCTPNGGCDDWSLRMPGVECSRQAIRDDRCDLPRGLAIGGPEVTSWVTGRDDPAIATALANGAVVVFDARWVADGHVTLARRFGGQATISLPAVVAEARAFLDAPAGVLAKATALRAHLPVGGPLETILTTTRMPTRNEQAEASAATGRNRVFDVYVERGFAADNSVALLALLAASTLVTVGATGIATGLAAADSRPDLATLAAVGAAPRVRRRLATAQAATVAALGSALGILAGLVPAIAVVAARTELPLVLPWPTLAATAVGVPLLAASVIGLCTRSRLPLDRRLV
jgi:putative ABC transport system permease protein